MKKVIFLLAGASFALGYVLVRRSRTFENAARPARSVDALAKTLHSAGAAHHPLQ